MKNALHPKRPYISAVMFAFLFMARGFPAQDLTPDTQSPVKENGANRRVAYINIQEVIADCMEGKRESENWKRWMEKKRSELQEMQTELDTLRNKLDVQGDKLTEEARFDLVDTIDDRDTLFQRAQQDVQKEKDKRQRRLANTVYQKVLPIIRNIAEERILDAVYFMDANRDAYIKPSLLITEEVIKAYDKAYPVEGTVRAVE